MALSSTITRKIFLYFGIAQASQLGGVVGGHLIVTPGTDKLQTALNNLTADGETSVTELVGILDTKWADLQGVSDSLQVREAGAIKLRSDEFDARRRTFNYFLGMLDQQLFPGGLGLVGGSGASGQGAFFEP